MKLMKNISINEPYIIDYKKMNESDIKEAYAYILLAEYDLFRIHLENGVSEEAYGVHPRNLGRFVYDIRSYYDDKSVNALIYLDTGLYRGFIAHRKDVYKGEYIVSLYVDKDSRKNGVAETLLRKVIENTREDKITVLVGDFNTPAINLYKKLGFKPLDKSNIKGMTEYQLVKGDK